MVRLIQLIKHGRRVLDVHQFLSSIRLDARGQAALVLHPHYPTLTLLPKIPIDYELILC